jgi:hypothetical protein
MSWTIASVASFGMAALFLALNTPFFSLSGAFGVPGLCIAAFYAGLCIALIVRKRWALALALAAGILGIAVFLLLPYVGYRSSGTNPFAAASVRLYVEMFWPLACSIVLAASSWYALPANISLQADRER